MLNDSQIILGVTGSIAAFKAIEVLRLLTLEEGARVTAILTRHATQFVTPLSFSVLSGRPCLVDQFEAEETRASFIPLDQPGRVPIVHIDLARQADLVVVAPASANLLGKVAGGIADDLLTVTIMATTAPVLFAPAMNSQMWANRIVQENVRRLGELGYHFVGPDAGDLACGIGPGRMAEPAAIVGAARGLIRRGPLTGKVILVTAGRTEEQIDPVRTLTNRSSGKMGFALAAAARDLGAQVILIAGGADEPPPPGVEVHAARSAAEMQARVLAELERADALVMAAAVSDYRPRTKSKDKIARGATPLTLELEPTADILKAAAEKKGKRIHVGFALETGSGGLERARQKLEAKALDFIVLNGPEAIGQEMNAVVLVDAQGSRALPLASKLEVA
ncbi:MAG TPA: bifunctional phosphopantothenoylcysteine decarboxylase/phosphopantothenate--cysteine ligase CoaBC, partial [Candidatus Udaeobacter sp.]|nr:bifunctional phosphopantothenoylcysteine decarboxylase/phosphopantothenate--cysteine ligase CoaBC [Candidatus Udaeobacter sp.]